MSYYLKELSKIQTATSGLFSRHARFLISQTLSANAPQILELMIQMTDQRKANSLGLINSLTKMRQDAIRKGNTSYKNSDWAAAAACDNWLQAVLLNEAFEFDELFMIVTNLIARAHKTKLSKTSAAQAARAVVLKHFEEDRPYHELFNNASVVIDHYFDSMHITYVITQGDYALIMLQALYFVHYHEEAIRNHMASMAAYRRGVEQGIYLSFSSRVSAYMNDIPCLEKFKAQ